MKRCTFISLVSLFATVSRGYVPGLGLPWAPPTIVAMEISPEQPTPSDDITIAVSCQQGTFSRQNGQDLMRFRTEGNELWFDIDWTYVLRIVDERPVVSTAIVTYTQSVDPLAPGEYTLHVTNYWSHDNSVLSEDQMTFVVSVPGSVDAAPTETCNCFCHRWPGFYASRPCPFCGCNPGYSSDAHEPSNAGGNLLDSLRRRIADLRQK